MRVRDGAAYAFVLWSCVHVGCVWFAYVRMCACARACVYAWILLCLVVLVVVRVIVCVGSAKEHAMCNCVFMCVLMCFDCASATTCFGVVCDAAFVQCVVVYVGILLVVLLSVCSCCKLIACVWLCGCACCAACMCAPARSCFVCVHAWLWFVVLRAMLCYV